MGYEEKKVNLIITNSGQGIKQHNIIKEKLETSKDELDEPVMLVFKFDLTNNDTAETFYKNFLNLLKLRKKDYNKNKYRTILKNLKEYLNVDYSDYMCDKLQYGKTGSCVYYGMKYLYKYKWVKENIVEKKRKGVKDGNTQFDDFWKSVEEEIEKKFLAKRDFFSIAENYDPEYNTLYNIISGTSINFDKKIKKSHNNLKTKILNIKPSVSYIVDKLKNKYDSIQEIIED